MTDERIDPDEFTIRWDDAGGEYKVSIPNFRGPLVVVPKSTRDARDREIERLTEALAALAASSQPDHDTTSEALNRRYGESDYGCPTCGGPLEAGEGSRCSRSACPTNLTTIPPFRQTTRATTPDRIDHEALDCLEGLVRDLQNERGEIEAAIAKGREVANEIRRAARQAGEAAGMIGMEISRLRR
jgi:hypothetical protein